MKGISYKIGFIYLVSILSVNLLYAGDLKIGYVDVEKVFNDYKKTQQNDAVLKEKGQNKAKERASLVADIKKQKEELDLLSDSGKLEKQSIIDEKIKALKRFDDAAKVSLRNERDAALKDIFNDIKTAIERYGKENGFEYIFNDKALLFKNESTDLTAAITEKLNTKD